MDVCRWTGVTRGDSTSWRGLKAIFKKKKKNWTFIQQKIKSSWKLLRNEIMRCHLWPREGGEITPGSQWSHCEIGADLKNLKMCQISAKSRILHPRLYFLVMCCYSKMLWRTHYRFLGSSESLIFLLAW